MSASVKEKRNDENEIRDKYYVISILFFFMGIVHTLPWSFFVTANEYWMYKFRDTSMEFDKASRNKTSLQYSFSAVLSITLTIADVTFLFLCMFFGHLFKVKTRVISSLFIIAFLFVVAAIFIPMNTDGWQMGFFVLTMSIVAGVNALNAILGMTLYTILSHFPKSYLGPYLNGQGLAGILSASLQISSLSADMSVQNDALLYFSLGIGVNVLAVIILLLSQKNQYYILHMSKIHNGEKEKVVNFDEFLRLGRKIWPVIATLGFWILTVLPIENSVTSLVISEGAGMGNRWNDVYFRPTFTFLVPTICGFIGRNIASKYRLNVDGRFVVLVSGLRMIIFIPLVMLCNAQPRHLPVVFPHDYQYIIIMIFLSSSNGYLLNLCSFMIPKLVTQAELNNAYQVYMVSSGILLGVGSFSGYVSLLIL